MPSVLLGGGSPVKSTALSLHDASKRCQPLSFGVVWNAPTVGGQNPAPLGSHGKPLFVGITRESSCQGFLGGAGFGPPTVC